MDDKDKRIAELTASEARLRAALQEIIDGPNTRELAHLSEEAFYESIGDFHVDTAEEALSQQPSEGVAVIRSTMQLLFNIRRVLESSPVDCLGDSSNDEGMTWAVRDEVIDSINKTLAAAEKMFGEGGE